MVIIITGASHTGKTKLAQDLLEVLHYPYLSIDHLKMGLIRSGVLDISVYEDDKLRDYLWPIVVEIIKTSIENNQNLIVEGIYVPFNWKDDFSGDYLSEINYNCLIMSENYIEDNYDLIIDNSNIIEKRLKSSTYSKKEMLEDNIYNLEKCLEYSLSYTLIYDDYKSALNSLIKDLKFLTKVIINNIKANRNVFKFLFY